MTSTGGIPATASEKIIALTTATASAAVREITTMTMTIYSAAADVGFNTVEAVDRAG